MTATTEVFDEPAALYECMTESIRQEEGKRRTHQLSIASLHGHTGARIADHPARGAFAIAFKGFVESMERIIADDWRVREVINVASAERLGRIEKHRLQLPGSYFQVRAVTETSLTSVLLVLIVGSADVFIGRDDNRHHAAQSGIHVYGEEAARWALSYFEELWNVAPYRLREVAGTSQDGLNRLRAAVNGGARGQPPIRTVLQTLHPIIREACEVSLLGEDYASAVMRAAGALQDVVRNRSRLRDLDGEELMGAALGSKPGGQRRRVRVADLKTQTGRNIQKGTLLMAQGIIAGGRNPVAHGWKPMRLEALELIGATSLLVRRILDREDKFRSDVR